MVNYLWENLFRKEKKERDVINTLKENYLFEPLGNRELKFVRDIVHVRNYRPEELVFRQGEIGVGMYIILDGAIEIYVEDAYLNNKEKNNSFITRLEAGDFFGELSLVEEEGQRTASAMASKETTLIGFFKPDLMEIIERNPSTGVKIVLRLSQVLGKRLKETTRKVSELKGEMSKLHESTGN